MLNSQALGALGATFVLLLLSAAPANAEYLGASNSVLVEEPGCNASSPVEVPGSRTLFINRQLITADGQFAGITGPNDCSGGNPENLKNGKIYNRWGLTLNRMDWKAHRLTIVKPLLDTSLDPATGRARAVVTGGPMAGAIIQSAYDADIKKYHGEYFVVYECIITNGGRFGVTGTSSCISIYDPERQEIDLSRTKVIVSGVRKGGVFYAASTPQLLVFQDRLYLYWATLAIKNGKFSRITDHGAELEVAEGAASVKGSGNRLIHSDDDHVATEVWGTEPDKPMSDTAVNIGPLWASGNSVFALSSQGGEGCAEPSGASQGCFRMVLVKSARPLGFRVFNHGEKLCGGRLPTNPQEYARPIADPEGRHWLIGHFIRPPTNGYSETRPVPGGDSWKNTKSNAVLAMFPLDDCALWSP